MLKKCPVEEIAAGIAGEGAPGSVGTVESWGKTNDQKLRLLIAERRHRPTEITRVLLAHLIQKKREPGASSATLLVDLRA